LKRNHPEASEQFTFFSVWTRVTLSSHTKSEDILMHIETALLKGATPEAIKQLKHQLGDEALAIHCAYYRSLQHFSKQKLSRIKNEIDDAIADVRYGDSSVWSNKAEVALHYLLKFHQVKHWKYRQWLCDAGFENSYVSRFGDGRDPTWMFLNPLAAVLHADLPCSSTNASRDPHYMVWWLSNGYGVKDICTSRGRRLGKTGTAVAQQLLDVCRTGELGPIVAEAQLYIERLGRAELPIGLEPNRLLDMNSVRRDYEMSLEKIKSNLSIQERKRFFRDEQHIKSLIVKAETLTDGFPIYINDLENFLKDKDPHLAVWKSLEASLARGNQLEIVNETIAVLLQGIPEEFFLAKKEKDLLG